MNRLVVLAALVIAVVGIGGLIGMNFTPDAWYAGLNKPFFNPPGWLFAPVWTVLYVLIAIAGRRVWLLTEDSHLRGLWVAQMVLNFAWSPAFFGAKMPLFALIVILILLGVIFAFIRRARAIEPLSATLFLPYAA